MYFAPNERLTLTLAAAVLTDIVVGITDIGASADTPTTQRTQHSAASTVDIVTHSATIPRHLKTANIRNKGSVSNVYTLAWSNGTDVSDLMAFTLKPGQSYRYADGSWDLYDTDGVRVTKSLDPGANPSVTRQRTVHARASLATLIAGADVSFWSGTGFPAQGAIPAAAAVCSNTLAGAFPLSARSGGQKRRLVGLSVHAATASQTFHLEDRLAHMGGLSGTVATAQTVGIDLLTLAGTNNLAARKGAADYSEVEWFMEWYTATGATGVTPTVNVTYDDGSTGNASLWVLGAAALPASVAASRRYQVLPAVAGRYIRGINTVTHATTGTAGNYGFTAVRKLASIVSPPIAYRREEQTWDKSNAPVIEDQACLTFAGTMTATSSGIFTGQIVQDVSEV